MMQMTNSKKTIFGTFWNVTLNFFNQASALIIYALLARILDVKDFGLIAFCFLITEMALLFGNFGVNQILIQRNRWSDRLASTCYWFLVAIAIFFALVIIGIVAPFSEHYFYKNSGLMLSFLSLVPIINSFSLVSLARMQRNFQNKAITKINVLGTTVGGGLSVYLVFSGYSVWAVIIGRVLQTIITSCIIIHVDKFRPKYPIDKKIVTHIANFGLPLFYNTCLNFVSQRSINLVTAFVLGSTQFAFVSVAQRAFRMISEITVTPLNGILLPSFSRVKEKHNLTAVYVRVVRLAATVIVPIYIGIAALSQEVVYLVFGPQWNISASILAILCFTIIPNILVWFLPALLISRSHTKVAFRSNLISTLSNLVSCSIGASISLEYAVIGLLLSFTLTAPLKFFIANQCVTVKAFDVIMAASPAILSAVFMYTACFLLSKEVDNDLPIMLLVLYKVLLGSFVYITSMLIVFRKYTMETLKLFISALKSN